MSREKDDGLGIPVRGEVVLKVEATRSGHAHIEDEASRSVRKFGVKELACRCKTFRINAG
jgi:hypothetical protein